MWNSLGSAPQVDEIEVTVFGPGFGESIVVHLGNGEWMIVDSCVDRTAPNKLIAPLYYLRQIGVAVEDAVKYIVASHWDDDHIQGMDDIVEACPNAKFICPASLPDEKFITFVEAISKGASATNGGNVKIIRRIVQILDSRKQAFCIATPGKKVNSSPDIFSWSPSDFNNSEFFQYLARQHPKAVEAYRSAIPEDSNHTSIVITVDWSDTAVLLGADLEVSANPDSGWCAVISEVQHLNCTRKADLVKVPHHGSSTAHAEEMWSQLVNENPISVIAPFGRGPITGRPPKSDDIRRISKLSGKVFLTARHLVTKTAQKNFSVIRSLREGNITFTSTKGPLGIVRHRRLPKGDWTDSLFGSALRVY